MDQQTINEIEVHNPIILDFMSTEMNIVAQSYQELARQQKELDSKMKPLKAQLLADAETHKADFDKAFQRKYDCGLYIALRVSNTLEADKGAKEKLLAETADEYKKFDLDEKAILADAPKNKLLQKLLTKLGIKVSQKETFAIYAG
jgi:hypothetical protein